MVSSASLVCAQTTTFTYQGRFTDGGTAANGTYDMQFKLFDGSGNQISSTITNAAVTVSGGVFTVQLDYGAPAFSGADRFLEMGVRQAGNGEAYTVLSPRQPLTSTPYAIRAAVAMTADTATNATQLGGVAANQYVQANDARLSDARPPTANSASYIQNSGNFQNAEFNISGNGSVAGTLLGTFVTAAVHYNLGGKRVLSAPGIDNLFVGPNAGNANTTATQNSFFGVDAGKSTTTGFGNSFFGTIAGKGNTTGARNSFFGSLVGDANTTGSYNSFFGGEVGRENTTGGGNSFFGAYSGEANKTGTENAFFGLETGNSNTASRNSFFGAWAGYLNTTASDNSLFGHRAGIGSTGANNSFFGSNTGVNNTLGFANSFFGKDAGTNNTTGSTNTIIGAFANPTVGSLNNATAIGFAAQVSQSNSLVLGSMKNVNGATDDTNVGIGTPAPPFRLTVKTPTSSYGVVHTDGTITVGTYVGGAANGGYIGTRSNHPLHLFANDGSASLTVQPGGNVGIGTTTPKAKLEVRGGYLFIANPSSLIMTSPNGACWFVGISNTGALSTVNIACP
jgi:hypothetical protein